MWLKFSTHYGERRSLRASRPERPILPGENRIRYPDCRTSRTSLQTATSTRRVMRAAVAQGVLVSPVLFSLYVNDIPTPSRHLVLAQYADGTAVIATYRDPSLLVGYLQACLGRLELCLRSLSTSARARLCCLPRLREASDSPGQCSYS
jgi:hypothetical protein